MAPFDPDLSDILGKCGFIESFAHPIEKVCAQV